MLVIGLRLLHTLLNALKSRIATRDLDMANRTVSHFQIDEILELTQAGNILSGTLLSGVQRSASFLMGKFCRLLGSIEIGQLLRLGPDSDGKFDSVRIKTLRCNQVPVRSISAGQTATISVTAEEPLSGTEEQTSEGVVSSYDDGDVHEEKEETECSVIKRIRLELREASMNCGVPCGSRNPSALEGTALLSAETNATTHGCFEAILYLAGGQWPPRGLISGKWPPHVPPDSESDSQSSGSCNDLNSVRLRSCSPLRPKKKHQGCYTVEVYCGGIRQSASVTSMEELDVSSQSVQELPSAVKAAAVMAGGLGEDAVAGGCIARIRFQFQTRPEWLRTGDVLVIRDQTQGLLSGVGVISDLS